MNFFRFRGSQTWNDEDQGASGVLHALGDTLYKKRVGLILIRKAAQVLNPNFQNTLINFHSSKASL